MYVFFMRTKRYFGSVKMWKIRIVFLYADDINQNSSIHPVFRTPSYPTIMYRRFFLHSNHRRLGGIFSFISFAHARDGRRRRRHRFRARSSSEGYTSARNPLSLPDRKITRTLIVLYIHIR